MTTVEAIKELARVWQGRIEEMKERNPNMAITEIESIVSASIKKEMGLV